MEVLRSSGISHSLNPSSNVDYFNKQILERLRSSRTVVKRNINFNFLRDDNFSPGRTRLRNITVKGCFSYKVNAEKIEEFFLVSIWFPLLSQKYHLVSFCKVKTKLLHNYTQKPTFFSICFIVVFMDMFQKNLRIFFFF